MLNTQKSKANSLPDVDNPKQASEHLLSNIPVNDETHKPNKAKVQRQYQCIWTLIGELNIFQGDNKSKYFSSGRLILLHERDRYKAVYCYSVSKEYEDQARVTAICEGTAGVEMDSFGTEQLVLTCDIITRTAIKKLQNSSKHFRMILYPSYNEDNKVIEMIANFNTKNSVGKLIFKRG